MKKIAVYLSSRNNYSLLEDFIHRNNLFIKDYYFVNVDDFSDPEETELGKSICSKYNITFLSNSNRGLQNSALTMINHLADINSNVKFIVWMTHDSHPISDNFYTKFEELVSSDKLNNFGVVGFNII